MRKKRNQKGFTIAEMMIVVGIISVLAGVAFTSVVSYMRSLTKLQYDGYARELFVAAQNHLTMAQSQGYLGRTDFGTEEDGDAGIYYFVVSGTHAQLYQQDSVLSLMLPVASVDEALRFGMSYVIRYHRELGQVMDVFCWSETVGRYPYRQAADYAGFLKNKDNRNIMMRYGEEKSVIG
jgi:prepilin-type N-terminal cleavage/methylation domain-containing protein